MKHFGWDVLWRNHFTERSKEYARPDYESLVAYAAQNYRPITLENKLQGHDALYVARRYMG